MAVVTKRRTVIGPGLRRNAAPSARSRLRRIREEIIAEGTRLLSLEEIRREVAERRGSYIAKRR